MQYAVLSWYTDTHIHSHTHTHPCQQHPYIHTTTFTHRRVTYPPPSMIPSSVTCGHAGRCLILLLGLLLPRIMTLLGRCQFLLVWVCAVGVCCGCGCVWLCVALYEMEGGREACVVCFILLPCYYCCHGITAAMLLPHYIQTHHTQTQTHTTTNTQPHTNT